MTSISGGNSAGTPSAEGAPSTGPGPASTVTPSPPWTASAAVRQGSAENELTVRAIGPRLTLIVNGIEAASAEDATLPEGTTGVFVGGDQNSVVLRELRVETPS